MLSEIVQFHQLVNLVRELNKPVEMSDDSLIALDDDIILLEQQNADMLEALKDALKFIHPLSSFMGKEGTTEKKIKAAIAKVEGKT